MESRILACLFLWTAPSGLLLASIETSLKYDTPVPFVFQVAMTVLGVWCFLRLKQSGRLKAGRDLG